MNVARQIRSGTNTDVLTGLGLDDIFTVNDSGVKAELPDGLPGSTLGLVSSSNGISTSYSYQPFGQKTTSGSASNNPATFQRGVQRGGGCIIFRARYYNPALQRWISRDPLGIGGDDANLYAYVGNDPINFSDPLGLNSVTLEGGCPGGDCGGMISLLTTSTANTPGGVSPPGPSLSIDCPSRLLRKGPNHELGLV